MYYINDMGGTVRPSRSGVTVSTTNRKGIISRIQDLVGAECGEELAAQVFDHLRADGQIVVAEVPELGFVLLDSADVLGVAASLIAAEC